jgi:ABC-2 type transport system permease protein
MNVSWLIAQRELKERIKTRSFIGMAIAGPILVLLMVYILFSVGENNKPHWKVLIVDPSGIMDNKILANTTGSISYDFANDYIQLKEFEKSNRFQKYDALLELNEKILSNKAAFLFYKEKPSFLFATTIQFHLERRLEEVMVGRFSKMSVQEFRGIKQPISIAFRNLYDPKNESYSLSGWVGFFFGAVILLFILLFGMTILRSVSSEKSNRIVEVLLASVKPRQLMFGKIAGIGIAAIIQFIGWMVLISLGLYVMRETLFPDMMDISSWNLGEMANQATSGMEDGLFRSKVYNDFVELIYSRIQFGDMLFFFLLFFIGGYIFYGTFFAALGATSGSENDGQQFVLPIMVLLVIALWAGYYTMQNPLSDITYVLSFLPFTSPMVCMVKLAQGYSLGEGYQIYVSFSILALSSYLTLRLAGRLYQNGILQFGHRLRLTQFISWLKHG